MTELDLIVDLHRNTSRQGPGSIADTLRALQFIDLPEDRTIAIADIGCGTGGQTITLAEHTNSNITAIDLFPEFLTELKTRSTAAGLSDRIGPVQASMDDLHFKDESFDIIWSEGAIYNIGFENGIKTLKPFIKKGGYLAVSEITWITSSRPKEIEEYWIEAYPEIDTAANKMAQIETQGFSLAGYFFLSPSSWLDTYYAPLQESFHSYLAKHEHSDLAQQVIQEYEMEMKLYQRFQDYYSYGFYVARRV